MELPPPDDLESDYDLPPADPVEGSESKLRRLGRQAYASLLDTPSIVPGLYALLGMGTEKLGLPLPGADAALQMTKRMGEWANETAGTTQVEDTADAAARVAASIALPIPGGWIKSLLPVQAALKAAPKTTKLVGNIAEVLTPATVNPSAARYALGGGVGVGLYEAGNALENDPSYKSLLPNMGQDRTQLALPPPDDAADPDRIGVALPMPDPPDDDKWSNLAMVGGAAAMAIPAWYAMRRSGGMLRSATIAGPDPELTPFKTATTPGESLITQTQDAKHVLTSQLGRATDDVTEKAFEQQIDLMTRAGGAAQIDTILKSGIYPGGAIRGPAMVVVQKEFQQLTPEAQQRISQGMVGQDLLENRAYIRKSTKDPNRTTDLPGIDDATAKSWAQALEGDAQSNLFAMRLRQTMRDALEYAAQEGRISKSQLTKMLRERPMYVPMRRAGEDLSESEFNMLLQRTTEAGKGAQEVLNPIQSAESYIAELTRRTMNNTVRRDWLDKMKTTTDQGLLNSFKQVDEWSSDAVTIYRDGKPEHYVFADPLVKKALELNPIMANSAWAAGFRSFNQQNQTGVFAPLKSVRSMIWDTIAAANYREAGRSFGLLDGALQAASNGKFAFRGDIVGGIGSAAIGLGRTAGARLAATIAEGIEADLRSGTGMWNQLPKPMATMVATRMRDAYLNSVYHAFERGGRNAALLNDDMLQASQMLKGSTDRLKNSAFGRAMGDTGLASLWRFYTQTLDTLQNAVKVQYVAENMGRAPTDQLVHEARSIGGGDMSLRGLGRVDKATSTTPAADKTIGLLAGSTKLAADWLPYANATLQGLAKLGEVAARPGQRMTFVAGLAGSVGSIAAASVILNSGMSPEWREAYWSMPSWWRMSNIPLPVGDKFGDMITVPVPPELSPVVAMVQNGVDQMLGLSNGQAAGIGPDMWQAIKDTVGFPMPPMFNAALALGGGRASIEQGIQEIPTSKVVPGYSHAGAVLPANITEALASIAGSSATMLLETASAIANKGGVGPAEGVDAAAIRGGQQLLGDTTRNVPVFGSLWGGARDYSSNEVSKSLAVKMQALDNMDNALRNAQPRGGIMPVPTSANPAFNSAAMQVRFYLTKNPAVQQLKRDIKTQQNTVEGLNAIYPKTADTMGQLSGAKRELRNMRDKLARQISDMEASIGRSLEEIDPQKVQ